MSAMLRFLLEGLAQAHMCVSLGLLVYVLSPSAEWACEVHKNNIFCHAPASVWTLQKAFPDTVAICVQIFLMLTACVHFGSVLMGRVRGEVAAMSGLDAIAFVFGILPWALVLGFLDNTKYRPGTALWIAVGSSFVTMVAACLALTALFATDSKKRATQVTDGDTESAIVTPDTDRPLLASKYGTPMPNKGSSNSVLVLMEACAYTAVGTAGGAVIGLYRSNDSYLTLGAKGCQIAVLLLALDVAVLATAVRRRIIDIQMGAIVATSISLVGWITGIVGCALTATALGSFETAATSSLLSVLASAAVFGVGIYVGTHFS